VATCVASPEVGVVAWQQLDPKTRCLRHELFELEALVGSFGDLAATERAVAAVDDLATPDACGRAATGRGVPEPPVELLDAVEDARVELDRVEATIAVGRYAEAVDRLDELAPRVDEIGFAPLRVELDDLRTMAIVELTPADDTEARIFHNVWEAEASGYDVLALEGLRRAIHYITARQREPERGEQWLPLAEAMARRTGDDAQEARTLALRGVVQTNLRRFDDADRSLREAIRRLEAGGHSSYQAQMQLAYALMRSDRVVEAIEIIERVLEAETERLGAHHPVIANRLAMLATAQLELGRNRDAERALQRSAAILAEVRGTHHTQWYLTMNNLGVAAERDHRYDEAHAYYQRALDEIPEGSVAFRLEASMITHNLAYLERTAGRLDRALALERRAYALAVGHDPELESLPAVVLTIATIAYECGAPEIARREHARVKALDDWADSAPTMLDELVFDEALVAWSEGDRAQAIAQCERADELFAQHAREADLELHVGVVLTCAELLREDGRCADALVHARRAVARAAEPPGEPARGVAAVELAEARACADGETRSADEIARARLLAAEYWWAESDLHRARRWARGDAAWLAAHEIRCPSRDELNADLPAPPDAAAP
ncbi:MAG TPA: tetratricopeptide repeat protein, partial [Nannocystaceae bacterium]|nr:tetratricopeptide repeat protein [Nannocystaceae bacterium]